MKSITTVSAVLTAVLTLMIILKNLKLILDKIPKDEFTQEFEEYLKNYLNYKYISSVNIRTLALKTQQNY